VPAKAGRRDGRYPGERLDPVRCRVTSAGSPASIDSGENPGSVVDRIETHKRC
jgi:hypothetical protein